MQPSTRSRAAVRVSIERTRRESARHRLRRRARRRRPQGVGTCRPEQARARARRAARRDQPAGWPDDPEGRAPVRVIICEDHALVRDGLERLLGTHGFEIAASVDNPGAFLAAVKREAPDVCVVDVRLPPTFTDEGVKAAIEARRQVARTPGPDPLPVRRADIRSGALDRWRGGRRLPAEGPRCRPAPVRRSGTAGRRRRHSARSGGRRPAARPSRPRGSPGAAHASRARGPIADGGGPHEQRDRRELVVTERAVEKHVSNIFWKLDLPASAKDHRRVLAVLAWLHAK